MLPPSPRNLGWLNLAAAVAIPFITAMTVRTVMLVLRHGESRLELILPLVSAIGLAVAWRWLLLDFAPFALLDWRFQRAYHRADWPTVEQMLEAADRRGWMTDGWLSELAHARCQLGDYGRALEAFDRIAGPLRNADLEFARRYNHSVCLYELGELNESKLVFDATPMPEWPASMTEHVEAHAERLSEAGAEAPLLN